MLVSRSSPFGGQTRTLVLLALSLLDESFPRELARILGKPLNGIQQAIKGLEPGRLYSLKMFSCDNRDLVEPRTKKQSEATAFLGKIVIEGADVDTHRTFREMYSSNPEPRIPVWITYHWTIFRAKEATAKLTVSDWEKDREEGAFGQEQTFNFLELQPYRE